MSEVLHAAYLRFSEDLWAAYLVRAKIDMKGHNTAAYGSAAVMAFLSGAASIAADVEIGENALSEMLVRCLREAKKNSPRWG